MLAILAAGGAYLPLDAKYPRERLELLLEDARPAAVLTRGHLVKRLPKTAVPVLLLEATQAETEGEAGRAVPGLFGDHLAALFYTSGSTGRPKGVGVTHRAIGRLVLDPRWGFGAGDRVAQLASPSFDAATLEIWGALLAGACLVGLRRQEVLDPRDLAAAIREQGLTGMVLTSAWFHRVAAELPEAFAPLSSLTIGGEAGDPTAFARVLAAGAPRLLLHGYGPTETTTAITAQPIREVAAGIPTLPAGRPLAGVRVYALDRRLRLVPQGVPGELYAGGDRLARGYLGRPDLTAERFVPDPFGPAGGRLYATGDLARILPGGEVEILGRRDRQVKIRGFRIEPGEIEAVLAEHPGVAQAALLVEGGGGGLPREKRLIGFVAPRGELDAATLRAYLSERLPAFMVPADLVLRPELPLTAAGKVDREALARLISESPHAAPGGEPAPLTLTEELLATVWSGVLGGRRPQPHDSFFDLGGHSLLAAQLMVRIRDAFGVELPLVAVFEAPTLALMAAAVEGQARADAGIAAPAQGSWSPLVRLAAGPAGATPLVCVHGAAGTIAVFADLARLLQDEMPIYGLQARGLAEGQTPLARIEENAELYVEALRRTQPHGPYRLLGYSMGSSIAFEMAGRLAGEGEPVELLALIDFAAVNTGPEDLPPMPEVPRMQGIEAETVRRYRAVWRANHDAVFLWRPGRYAGKVLLVRAAEGGPPGDDPALGWGELAAGGVDVTTLPGDHFTLFAPPFVGAVAQVLRQSIVREEI
jgi:amino acid adenylation domain-containing protein